MLIIVIWLGLIACAYTRQSECAPMDYYTCVSNETCRCMWCWDGGANITNGNCFKWGDAECNNAIYSGKCDERNDDQTANIVIGTLVGALFIVMVIVIGWLLLTRTSLDCASCCCRDIRGPYIQ